MSLVSLLIFLCLPAFLIWAEPNVKLISWLSPAFWCYALGILFGNILPLDLHVSDLTQQAAVALAIPLLLFRVNSAPGRVWLARPSFPF